MYQMPRVTGLSRHIPMVAGILSVCVVGAMVPSAAQAHFQELIPSAEAVSAPNRPIALDMAFTHPMDRGPVMEMGRPARFGVMVNAKTTDLISLLKAGKHNGKTTFSAAYQPSSPGDHVFFLEPAPYWEPAEGKMIVHYTKVVVDVLGGGGGWDAPVGFPVEIEPLTRPYGLWTGNLFQGVVRKAGDPVPFAEIEVEWRNDGSVKAPSDAHVTQVVKADGNGVFSYAMPRAGWWGFAALIDGDAPMTSPEGKKVPVEQGALLWVKTHDMKN